MTEANPSSTPLSPQPEPQLQAQPHGEHEGPLNEQPLPGPAASDQEPTERRQGPAQPSSGQVPPEGESPERPSLGRSSSGRESAEQALTEQASPEGSTLGQSPIGQPSVGPASTEQTSGGQSPIGQTSIGLASAEPASAEQASSEQASTGQALTGQASSEHALTGQALTGQVLSGREFTEQASLEEGVSGREALAEPSAEQTSDGRVPDAGEPESEQESLSRALQEAQKRLRRAEKRAREAEKRAAYQQYRADYVKWQLESSFARRWWRLGEAIWQVKKDPTNLRRLPVDMARALRPSAMPAPPKKPRAVSGGKTARRASAAHKMPDIPSVALPDGPVNRPRLTVAVILDTFSASAFRYEWNQVEPGPDDWREVLERERPDLLFVESAWRGNDGRWRGQMSGSKAPGQALRDMVAYCEEQGIPTVFWNKEDPPNFDVFIETAKLFGHVFTTAAEMIPRYREILGHDRIDVLSFAAQPRLHNPVNIPGGRSQEVAFAGTYFSEKHPRRAEQMRTILEPSREFGLHIYSRMLAEADRFQFPEQYDGHVVGSLPYDRMLAAYKAYKVFLNVNSVLDSPTMCARRIFELSACRTPVLSGESAAIEEFFPGLVSVARTPEETRMLLGGLLANPELRDRQAHLAMREVFAKHTFAHRVDKVLAAAGLAGGLPEPMVSVILPTNRPERLDNALRQVAHQRWNRLQLVLVLHGLDLDTDKVRRQAAEAGVENVVVVEADRELPLGACLNLGIDAADGDLIAKMDDDDVYGEHYLPDLVAAFSYTDAGIVGKRACYVQLQALNATLLSKPELEHSYTTLVRGGTIVAQADVLRGLRFDPLPRGSDTQLLRRAREAGVRIYSADRFNYVYVRNADPSAHTFQVNDAELLQQAQVEFYGPPEAHVCI